MSDLSNWTHAERSFRAIYFSVKTRVGEQSIKPKPFLEIILPRSSKNFWAYIQNFLEKRKTEVN